MGAFHSFAQILEKKIRREIEKEFQAESSFSEGKPSEIQSELWTHLVGQMNTFRFQSEQNASVYHRNRPAPRPRPNHTLSESQTLAFDFFQSHKAVLAANFTRTDLKKAFRLLALRLHPDQGGNTADFRTLLTARAELEQLFR